MYTTLIVTAALLATPPSRAQGAAGQETDKAAITQAALDYAEGYYGGAPERMERALSPALSKRGLMVRPGTAPFLLQMNAETLIEACRTPVKLAPADRHITVEVLDIHDDIASARVFTAQFNDYLHLIRRNGQWQLLNVLWHPPLAAAPAADRAAVEGAAKDYVAALFAADGPRALALLHPIADLRTLAPAPQGRPRIVREQNTETMVAGLTTGQVKVAGRPEDAQVAVLGVDGDIASAKIQIGPMVTYLHLALQNGKWRIVNALAYPPPPAPSTR